MTTPNLQARRATIEDLQQLMPLWQQEGLPAEELGKRVQEFQVVAPPGGIVVGAVGLQIAGNEARLHSECFASPEDAESIRAKLWERVQMISKNHGLIRIWTQVATPFWGQNGFQPSSPELAKKLPGAFAGSAEPWRFLQLREDVAASPTLDKEFAMFKEMQQEETQRLFRQARTMKLVAAVIVLIVFIMTIILVVTWMKTNGARTR